MNEAQTVVIDVTEQSDVVSGVWKFEPAVTREQLVNLAKEWASGPDGLNYLRLSVRGVGQDRYGVEFAYRFEGKNHKRYFYKTAHELTERFGEVSYDLSSPTWSIEADRRPVIETRRCDGGRYTATYDGARGEGDTAAQAIGNLLLHAHADVLRRRGFYIRPTR